VKIRVVLSFLVASISTGLLAMVKVKSPSMTLLFDRFYPGAAWIQIFLLGIYGFIVMFHMLDKEKSPTWRVRIWLFFSIFFFGQFFMGLFLDSRFLMTGKLHLPVPALIIGGPLFRGSGYFMPILLASTILLAGPAWCSHLCYIGAWDNLASMKGTSRGGVKGKSTKRLATLTLVVVSSLLLRFFGVSYLYAGAGGLLFGITGLAIMVFKSSKTGYMNHCLTWCPIGIIIVLAGKISPFRMRIDQSCSRCYHCSSVCRYDALSKKEIDRRKPGLSCTLCGDCIGSCDSGSIQYSFGFFRGEGARNAFLTMVITLHTIFLGLARL
jgi:polyferredoxin